MQPPRRTIFRLEFHYKHDLLMQTNPIPERFRSDYIFLLVGDNPLPLYVSGLLLAKDGCKIYLLHSDGAEGTPSTKPFADLLARSLTLERPDITFFYYGLNEGNSFRIQAEIKRILSDLNLPRHSCVGLNYTGGTKPMAIQSHNVLAEHFPNVVFSYLDAHRLAIQFEGESSPIPVARAVAISLKDLARLHGYQVDNINQTPRHEKFAKALAEVHNTDDGIKQWQAWYASLSNSGGTTPQLPDINSYPALQPIITAFNKIGNGETTTEKIAEALGFEKIVSASKWFISEWLEDLVLAAIIENKQEFEIKHYANSLEPVPQRSPQGTKPVKFELDAAAMIGYQLYVFSCIVSSPGKDESREVKKHLMEAYVRAQQLGGDEARAAVVGTSKFPEKIEAEVEREWQAWGRVKVFGRYDLQNLSHAFRQWFAQSNR